MNILYISPCQGAFGGIEAFVLALADHMYLRGENVRVVFKKVKGFQLKHSLQHATKSKCYPVFIQERFDLRSMFKSIQWADFVHCHNPLFEVLLGSACYNKPCVLTVYNWCRRNLHPRIVLWRLASRISLHNWYISDFVWNSWEAVRKHSSGKMPVVSNLPSAVRSYENRSGFVFASRWIPNKGIRTLLLAYSRCRIDKTKWPLTLLGDGPLKTEILKLIKQEKIVVEITGFVSDKNRNQRISRAKWMIAPPNTNEDLGLTVIEARNVKVPCIASRDGGLTEAAGPFSLFFEPGNIDELASLMEKVALLSEHEYRKLADSSFAHLRGYLKPLSLYETAYRAVDGPMLNEK